MKFQPLLLAALVTAAPAVARAAQDPPADALEYSRLLAQYAALQEARAAVGAAAMFVDQRPASPPSVEAVQVFPPGAPGRQLAGFSIVLVQGDMTGSSAALGIPTGAAKALADLREFLPYKSYQLLDTQWASSSGHVTTRLQRPGQAYRLQIAGRMEGAAGQEVNVQSFGLTEVDGQVIPGEMAKVQTQLDAARIQLEQLMVRIDRGDRSAATELELAKVRLAAQQLQSQIAEAQAVPRAAGEERQVLTSSFRMKLGETVVVGTSKIAGDKALIVLLTAVPK